MIYSRWMPDKGGYEYFETPERYAMGDDLPSPSLFGESPIGIASVSCGRRIPAGARFVGTGPFAKGVVAPLDRTGLSGDGVMAGIPAWAKVLGAAAALGSALFFWRRAG